MKYSCYDCSRFYKTYRFGQDGTLYCCGRQCEIKTDVKTGDEAQTCYKYDPSVVARELPDQIKPAELLVSLKTELNYLKNVIDAIEKYYEEKPADE